MRPLVVTLVLLSLGACAAGQRAGSGPSSYATSTVVVEGRARAVCTPHVYLGEHRAFVMVRTVCELDDELYRSVERALRGQGPSTADTSPPSVFAPAFPAPQGVTHAGTSHDPEALAAAERIAGLLDDPDEIAGVGNPGRAFEYTRSLDMRVLLPALYILDERGRLDEIVAYAQAQQQLEGRLLHALRIHAIARATSPAHPAVRQTVERLAALTPQSRMDAVRYLASRPHMPPELEVLLEGFLALEAAHTEWREPIVVLSSGSSPPSPIEPGPWEKPEGEPAELYIGKQAHRVIAEYYRDHYPYDDLYLNHLPISRIVEDLGMGPHRLSEGERALRPDIVNLTQLHVYEIKPASRMGEGVARALFYVGILGKAGVSLSLGPAGAPGTSGYMPAPGGVFIFSAPLPGVITYQYRRGRLVPTQVTDGQESEGSSWSMELEPLTEAQQRSLLWTGMAIAASILFFIVTAPASG